MDVARADAVQRREPAHEHEIEAFEGEGLLDHDLVRGRLHHAQLGEIALAVLAGLADHLLGEGIAQGAVTDGLQRLGERLAQAGGGVAVVLQQVESHALRGLGADAGQPAQRFGQEGKTGGRFQLRSTE